MKLPAKITQKNPMKSSFRPLSPGPPVHGCLAPLLFAAAGRWPAPRSPRSWWIFLGKAHGKKKEKKHILGKLQYFTNLNLKAIWG